jgi:hypothetical protein
MTNLDNQEMDQRIDANETVLTLLSSETQPCLPSGQIINAKNTLQSFARPRGHADGNLNIANEEGINSSNDPSTAVAVEVEISPTVNAEPIDSVALANLYNARNNWQQQQIPHTKGKLIFLMCYVSTIVVVAMVAGVGVYCGVGKCSPDGTAKILTSAPMQVGVSTTGSPPMQSNVDNTSISSPSTRTPTRPPTPFFPPTLSLAPSLSNASAPLFECPLTQQSGGAGQFKFLVDVKETQGTFNVSYNMYDIPDAMVIAHEGIVVYSTNGLVSGQATVLVTYGSGNSTSTIVSLSLSAPEDSTAWEVFVACAI